MADNARLKFGQQVYDYFVGKGLAPHQAAAMAGNMAWEGAGRTDLVNVGDNPRFPAAPHSFGISQWNGDRLQGLVNYARSQGANIPAGNLADPAYLRSIAPMLPLETQLGYAWQEMQGPEGRAFAGVKGAPDLRGATAGAIGYYRPAGWSAANPEAGHGFPGRLALADAILKQGPGAPPEAYDAYGLVEPPKNAPTAAPMAMAPSAAPDRETPPAGKNPGLLSILAPGLVSPGENSVLGALFGPPKAADATEEQPAQRRQSERQAQPEEDLALPMAPFGAPRHRPADLSKILATARSPMRLGIGRA